VIDEIDLQINELETRIDRLRALYEQYFLGFERTEPHVPRKDVERRIHDLRKIRFNNTARRFKFQTLVQRYNTMQQYWGRICREIELGTYKRHKLKAERTIGQLDASHFNAEAGTAAAAAAANESPAEKGQDRRQALTQLASDFTEMLDAGADLDAELNRALAAATEGKTPQKPLEGQPDAAKPEAKAKPSNLLSKLGRRAESPDVRSPQVDVPGQAAAKVPSSRPVKLTSDVRQGGSPPAAPAGQASGAERPNKPITMRPTLALTRDSSRPPPPQKGPSPEGPKTGPGVLPPNLAETILNQSAPLPARPGPPKLPARPLPSKAPPTAAAPAPPLPPARPNPSSALSDAQLRTLHERYLKARADTNATPVSFEKLERSLRETERQLREKTKGRKVDFDVSIEDGRAVIKPRLA